MDPDRQHWFKGYTGSIRSDRELNWRLGISKINHPSRNFLTHLNFYVFSTGSSGSGGEVDPAGNQSGNKSDLLDDEEDFFDFISRNQFHFCLRCSFFMDLGHPDPPYLGDTLSEDENPVFQIYDILVRIRMRIRILGSFPLTNGSGCGSGPQSSVTWMQKNRFFIFYK